MLPGDSNVTKPEPNRLQEEEKETTAQSTTGVPNTRADQGESDPQSQDYKVARKVDKFNRHSNNFIFLVGLIIHALILVVEMVVEMNYPRSIVRGGNLPFLLRMIISGADLIVNELEDINEDNELTKIEDKNSESKKDDEGTKISKRLAKVNEVGVESPHDLQRCKGSDVSSSSASRRFQMADENAHDEVLKIPEYEEGKFSENVVNCAMTSEERTGTSYVLQRKHTEHIFLVEWRSPYHVTRTSRIVVES